MINLFIEFGAEEVSVTKPDGTVHKRVKAIYDPNYFLVRDVALKIEEGDKISRFLPNGATEEYSVFRNTFRSEQMGFPAFLRVDVRRVA